MIVEEALIELGDKALSKSPYSKTLHAMLNAYLPGEGTVTYEMDGHDLLAMIYMLPDETLQSKILTKPLAKVRCADAYRNIVLTVAFGFGMATVGLAFTEMLSNGGFIEGGGLEVLNKVIGSMTELVKAFKSN